MICSANNHFLRITARQKSGSCVPRLVYQAYSVGLIALCMVASLLFLEVPDTQLTAIACQCNVCGCVTCMYSLQTWLQLASQTKACF